MSYLGIPDADLLSQSVFLSYSVFPSVLTVLVQLSHKKDDAHLGLVNSTFGG